MFFFFVSAFADKSDSPVGSAYQLKSDYSLQSQVAVIPNDALQVIWQKNTFPVIVKTDFKQYGESYKTVIENSLISNELLFLQKAELLIRPIIMQKLYCQYHSIDTTDVPVLS